MGRPHRMAGHQTGVPVSAAAPSPQACSVARAPSPAFVEDKARAIRECVRVTKPGGYVGMNETICLERPAEAKVLEQATAVGAWIPTAEEWQHLWDAPGVEERSFIARPIGMRSEVMSRIQ